MDNAPANSRKEVAGWLKQQPYSQNLNDGVLFCRVLQKTYPAYFLRLNEQPRTDFECLSNFKMLNRCLDKNGLYAIADVNSRAMQLDRFASSKDFFEFASWLKSFTERGHVQNTSGVTNRALPSRNLEEPIQTVRSPPAPRIKTAVSMSGSASTSTIRQKNLKAISCWQRPIATLEDSCCKTPATAICEERTVKRRIPTTVRF